jgi:hypothetical protein
MSVLSDTPSVQLPKFIFKFKEETAPTLLGLDLILLQSQIQLGFLDSNKGIILIDFLIVGREWKGNTITCPQCPLKKSKCDYGFRVSQRRSKSSSAIYTPPNAKELPVSTPTSRPCTFEGAPEQD